MYLFHIWNEVLAYLTWYVAKAPNTIQCQYNLDKLKEESTEAYDCIVNNKYHHIILLISAQSNLPCLCTDPIKQLQLGYHIHVV